MDIEPLVGMQGGQNGQLNLAQPELDRVAVPHEAGNMTGNRLKLGRQRASIIAGQGRVRLDNTVAIRKGDFWRAVHRNEIRIDYGVAATGTSPQGRREIAGTTKARAALRIGWRHCHEGGIDRGGLQPAPGLGVGQGQKARAALFEARAPFRAQKYLFGPRGGMEAGPVGAIHARYPDAQKDMASRQFRFCPQSVGERQRFGGHARHIGACSLAECLADIDQDVAGAEA